MSEKTFDELMKELEETVEGLENGELSLEKALDEYKKGVGIIKILNAKLDNAKKEISIIEKDTGNVNEYK